MRRVLVVSAFLGALSNLFRSLFKAGTARGLQTEGGRGKRETKRLDRQRK